MPALTPPCLPTRPPTRSGIGLTFVGLYMYQSAKGEVASLEKKVRKIEAIRDNAFLPSSAGDASLFRLEKPADSVLGGDIVSPFGTNYDGQTAAANGHAPVGPPPPPPSRLYPQHAAKSSK